MSVEELTPASVVHYDLEARVWMFSIRGTRYLHLVLNVLCLILACASYSEQISYPAWVFFLVITSILTATSLTLVVWHCTICCRGTQRTTLLKPTYEVIYYVVSGSVLFVATIILVCSGGMIIDNRMPDNYKLLLTTGGLGIVNVWMYMRNAFRLYLLSTPIQVAANGFL